MYAVLGEDKSDAQTIKVLIQRIAGDGSLKVKAVGFRGGSNLLRKGKQKLMVLQNLGFTRFIIAHDADGPDPAPIRQKIIERVIRPSSLSEACCIVIPVQEIEAWILADIVVARNVLTGWRPKAIASPESITNPKEELIRLSRDAKRRPRYDNAIHNERLAKYLDLEVIRQKCPSFRPLMEFVRGNIS